jgi:uncharacterized protein
VTLVAVIADTHLPRGARRLPDACVERLCTADLILHAGDVVAASVLEELAEYAPVRAVSGNVDQPALVETLPKSRVVEVGDARIGMIHVAGPRAGREARLAVRFPECHAIVYGHTHVPQVERYEGTWILNPGSPTERRSSPRHTMIVLRINATRVDAELVDVSP